MWRDVLAATSPEDWQYLAEGGANVVLKYVGSSSSLLEGKLIRVRKRKLGTLLGTVADDEASSFLTDLSRNQLGVEYVERGENVEIERSLLRRIEEKLTNDKVRPVERCQIDTIDIDRTYITLMTHDAAGARDFTVEIKPKGGFLPSRAEVKSVEIESQHCRFCRHQYHRNAIIPTSQLNQYCPLDLYSSERLRIRRAVDGLFSRWNDSGGGTNNLKIFDSQGIILPHESRRLDRIFDSVDHQSALDKLKSHLVDHLVAHEDQLARIRTLQSRYDPLSIAGLAKLFHERTGQTLESIGTGQYALAQLELLGLGSRPNAIEWERVVNSWDELMTQPIEQRSLRSLLLGYLLSATFKDCSILLSMRRGANGISCEYETRMRFIDLDPKPLEKIGSYAKLDRDIADSFDRLLSTDNVNIRQCYI